MNVKGHTPSVLGQPLTWLLLKILVAVSDKNLFFSLNATPARRYAAQPARLVPGGLEGVKPPPELVL